MLRKSNRRRCSLITFGLKLLCGHWGFASAAGLAVENPHTLPAWVANATASLSISNISGKSSVEWNFSVVVFQEMELLVSTDHWVDSTIPKRRLARNIRLYHPLESLLVEPCCVNPCCVRAEPTPADFFRQEHLGYGYSNVADLLFDIIELVFWDAITGQ